MLHELRAGKIERIYHEVSYSNSPIHTPIAVPEATFAPEEGKNGYLMHFAGGENRKESLARGVSIVST